MGKPAARLGDMTAHGGTVMVGFPMVLIGGMPAARIGDMHVCPMATPAPVPVPHVGGPISLGSPMVLIGGMPAARMGDMAVCVGPPDTIALGCMTVLIGEGGAGAAGAAAGGGAGAPASLAAQASAATAVAGKKETTTKEEHWVEIQFVDKAGNAVSGVNYKFTDTDNKESEGMLRLDGTIRRDGIKEGQCKVQLFTVSNAKWAKEKIDVGEKVKMSAETEGFEDNTPAELQIFKRDIEGADSFIETIQVEVKSNKIDFEWDFKYSEDIISLRDDNPDKYSSPYFYFDVLVLNNKARSGLLQILDKIEIHLENEDGNPLANEEYTLKLADGSVRSDKLDGNGYKVEENIPLGKWQMNFPKLPDFFLKSK
jgi:uncharacterized Zn-binding protein involved in type VI secretion